MGIDSNPADKRKKDPRRSSSGVIKKHWPLFLITTPYPWTWPGCYLAINVLVISQLLYPGLPFQAEKVGLIWGINLIVTAISRLCYGPLVDRYTRVRIITSHNIAQGIVFMLYALVPMGQGDSSFSIYLLITLGMAILNGGASSGGEVPVVSSYIDDAVEEDERSQVLGLCNMLQQMFLIVGSLLAALVFREFWQTYFIAVGGVIVVTGIIFGLNAKEPKRGAKKQELWKLLQMDTITYKYQLTKETFKSTIFSRTNLLVLFEGIFSQITAAVPTFLIFAFFESTPYNLAPFALSTLLMVFGIPGIFIGTMVFAKLSDRLGRRNLKGRIYLIFLGLALEYLFWFLIVLLPLSPLTPAEGSSISSIMGYPIYWVMCVIVFFADMFSVLYITNQRPVIQKINLPEAQGFITGANIFLENLGRGIGMSLAGYLLVFFNKDYVFTIAIMLVLGFVGALIWLFCLSSLNKDSARISKILEERATELSKQNSFSSHN